MLIFIGLPGSGKTVQGKLLADYLGYSWVSMGNLLRQQNNSFNRQIMLKGELVDDSVVFKSLEPEIAGKKQEIIIDGFPRSISQAIWLTKLHQKKKIDISAVIQMNISKKNALERIAHRGRLDDTKQAIMKRISDFIELQNSIHDIFYVAGIDFVEIDGNGKIDDVHQEILKKLITR